MHSARSTDSNGLAARLSACASTRRTASAPAPRTSMASRSARVTAPDRSAESAMASASSKGRVRAQSTIVRRGVVTAVLDLVGRQVGPVDRDARPSPGRELTAPADHHLGLRRLRLELPPVVRRRAPEAHHRREPGRGLPGVGRRREGVRPARALLDPAPPDGAAEPAPGGEAEQLFVDAVPPSRSRARVASMLSTLPRACCRRCGHPQGASDDQKSGGAGSHARGRRTTAFVVVRRAGQVGVLRLVQSSPTGVEDVGVTALGEHLSSQPLSSSKGSPP